jgi:hypothetical protein
MNKFFLALSTSAILATLACQLTSSVTMRVINHPEPEFPPISLAPFEAAGCTFNEYGMGECPQDGSLAELGCDQLRKPDDLLGGLDPAYPLALCLYYPLRHANEAPADPMEEPRFYNDGCMMPVYVRYVIYRDGDFEVLHTIDELSAAYALIQSPEEALSYSLAATGLEARFGQKREPGYRYFVNQLEDTRVSQVDEGYQINLYDYQVCGCGPHTTSIVTTEVFANGNIHTLEEQPAYENPAEDGLCVD